MKKMFLSVILGVSMIFTFTLVARGEEVTECKHTNMTTTVEEQAADCTHTYYRCVTSVCEDCGYRTFEVTRGSAYQHGPIKFVDNSTPATCMEQGWLCWSYICTLCGEKVGGGIQPIAKIEHAVDAGGYPTCYSGCAVQYQSTCTEHGYYESTVWCLECNCLVSHVKEELPLADHNWSAWEEAGGVLTRYCINCGETETQNNNPITRVPNHMIEMIKAVIDKFVRLLAGIDFTELV